MFAEVMQKSLKYYIYLNKILDRFFFLYKLLKTKSLALKLNLFVIFYARIIIIPKDNPKFFSLDQNQLSP